MRIGIGDGTMPGRLAKNFREVGSTALDMLGLRYPGFVYGETRSGAVPVFCFHGVEPTSLQSMLEFLKSNQYVTLDADEYHQVLTGQAHSPMRSVVLTFDDGWGSLWSVGFPLVKKYEAKITVFLPPGRIEHCDHRSPNLDDLEAGTCSAEEVLGRDKSDRPLLSWEEIKEMHASGLVDFQSHSYNHSLVCRSPRVWEFVSPKVIETSNLLELPFHSVGFQPVGTKPHIRLGEPMFDSAPRLSDTPGMTIDPSVAEGCAEFARENGGEQFFTRADWRDVLEHVVRKYLKTSEEPRVETEDEQVQAIRHELIQSKRAIEEMLPGKVVRHLCYPWHVAGAIARREAVEAGYTTGFLGRVGGRYYNPIPHDPLNIARLGGDFFFRLPGKGRVGLFQILMRKTARRVRQGSPYIAH